MICGLFAFLFLLFYPSVCQSSVVCHEYLLKDLQRNKESYVETAPNRTCRSQACAKMYFKMATTDRTSSYFIAASCSENCHLLHAKCLRLHGTEAASSGHFKVMDDILTTFNLQGTRNRLYRICCCSEDECNSTNISSLFDANIVIHIASAFLVALVFLR